MRTTITIDDDVLLAAKELARRQKRTAGQVISELARAGLNLRAPGSEQHSSEFLGFRPFAGGDDLATNGDVDALRDELGV